MGRPSLNNNRIGIIGKNKYGSIMEVVEYNTVKDVLVKFEQGNLVNVQWSQFCRGDVKNPHDKSIYGVGYLGEGDYKAYKSHNKCTDHYRTWFSMMNRCYSEKYKKEFPTYIDCVVCEDWHNFQIFAKWYDKNLYKVDGEKMNLDKDILVKGNKMYSPETCIIVPQNINKLFTKRDLNRGNCPIGVYIEGNRYKAQCTDGKGKRIYIGHFDDPKEAFLAYKNYKEKIIKQIAEEYKSRMPERLYNAMMNYIVEITD